MKTVKSSQQPTGAESQASHGDLQLNAAANTKLNNRSTKNDIGTGKLANRNLRKLISG